MDFVLFMIIKWIIARKLHHGFQKYFHLKLIFKSHIRFGIEKIYGFAEKFKFFGSKILGFFKLPFQATTIVKT